VSREQEPIPISNIRIGLSDQSITFESDNAELARLTYTEGKLYFQRPILTAEAPTSLPESGEGERADGDVPPLSCLEDAEHSEKQRPLVLQGRLLGQAREGKPDSRGRRTAWARFAAHQEGSENAVIYSATFHRSSAPQALSLPPDSRAVVQGYVHPSSDPEGGRLDSISVFRFLRQRNEPGAAG
jgi:hypothetical protein